MANSKAKRRRKRPTADVRQLVAHIPDQFSTLCTMASSFASALPLLIAASSALGQPGVPPEQELRRAVDAPAHDPLARGKYGIFLQQQGRTAEAIIQFRAAL